ncbi:phosphoribosyltransferase [Nitratiruptor sp. YY09-18]|uniref:phosphoribosyltransferase n=1 Tax=Nitratiruptor sp. YY09-18 TaxID=2724901 RepID=UPI0019155B32|nr:phosphoribosyltransferase [Nitratiruptor sp. YY09-18]BCD67441.1 putative phosphoribosyl transferase [Nitratiruptor sp. YY09-18]
MFKDRADAGQKLAKALEKYRNNPDVIVLAIPRGGVEVGLEVAKYLHSDFDMLFCRKLQYPWTTESGYGAICEDGTIFINEQALQGVTQDDIYREIERQEAEIAHRIKVLRSGKPLKDLTNKIVILTDDGVAMGSTMIAAVKMLHKLPVKKIVVAVPTASPQAVAVLKQLADEVVTLYTPHPFFAVADAYERWYDVSDEEVLELLTRYSIKND